MQEIEKNYDNIIRAQTLISYLNLNKKKNYLLNKKNDIPYYIAHPILIQIVLNKKMLRKFY